MHDVRRAADELGEALEIEHVRFFEAEVGMLGERGALEGVAMEVVEGDDLVRVDEAPREGRPDEPGTARDHDPFTGQRHAASLDAAYPGDMRLAVGLAVAALALAGGSAVPAAPSLEASLTVTYWPDGADSSKRVRWTLRCDPAAARSRARHERARSSPRAA